MKKSLRLLTLTVSVLMGLSVFSGCQSGKQTNAAASSGTANGSKMFGSDLTIHVMAKVTASQAFTADAPVFKNIYDKTGVKIELETFPGSDWDTKAKTLIATNNMPDVMLNTPNINNYVNSGVFLAVSDYTDKYAPNFKKLQDKIPDIKNLYVDGKLYTFPTLSRHINNSGKVPMIRTDILKSLSLNTPQSFDELYSTLEKFKQANPSVYPMINRSGTKNLFSSLAYPMGSGSEMYYDKDVNGGTWLYGPAHAEFKDVLTYLNKLYTNKILDPDYAVLSAQQWQEKLGTNKGTFFFDNPSYAMNFNKSLSSMDASFKFEPMLTLKNSRGQQRNYAFGEHPFNKTTISAKVKNPEKVVQFFDWLYSDEGADITNFGIEGKDYTKANNEYTVSKELVDKHKSESDPWRGYMGELGLGQLAFAQYVDDRNQFPFMSDVEKSWYNLWMTDKAMDKLPLVTPPLKEEDQTKFTTLSSKVSTMFYAEIDKFIMGSRPISEYDQFADQLNKAGAAEMEKIYKDAAAKVK